MAIRFATPLLTLPLVAAVSGCAYEAPINPNYQGANTIAGTIVADGITEPGTVFVLVFDAKNPPPPIGTGSPITFATVPATAFTADASGVKSAEYAVPYLPDTVEETGYEAGFLVAALMDVDGDFSPFAPSLGGSSCGDWLGEYKTDLSSLYPIPVTVEGGKLVDDVTVVLSRQNLIERPAFTIPSGLTLSRQKGHDSLVDPYSTQLFRLSATGVHTTYPAQCTGKDCGGIDLDLYGPCAQNELLDDATCSSLPAYCPCELTTLMPCETALWVHFVDADLDGVLDPYPSELQAASGIGNVWPRVYLQYLGAPITDPTVGTVFASDLGEFEWPPGTGQMVPERWVTESYPLAAELYSVGGIMAYLGLTFAPTPMKELSATFSPAFRHYHEAGAFAVDPANGPFDLVDLRCWTPPGGAFPSVLPSCASGVEVSVDDVPAGAWSVTVVSETGQSWTIPNEIGLPAIAGLIGLDGPLESTDAGFDVTTQAGYVLLE